MLKKMHDLGLQASGSSKKDQLNARRVSGKNLRDLSVPPPLLKKEKSVSLSAIALSIRAPISRLFPNLVGRNGSFHKSLASLRGEGKKTHGGMEDLFRTILPLNLFLAWS